MSNLPTLRDQFFDNNGAVLNGGKLYFYEPATTTTKAVYTTAARTVAHSQPVVLDAYGRAAEIYMTPAVPYRVVLKNSAGSVTYFDIDGIYADTLDDADLSGQFYDGAENPMHYGADGDGVDDESTDVQEALTAAAVSHDGVVDLLGRTYRCDSALSIPSGVTLRNGTLDFSACNADACIVVQGSVGSQIAFTAASSAGDNVLAVANTTGLSVGQLILIEETTPAGAELHRVAAKGATSITLVAPLRLAKSGAAGSTYRIVTSKSDVKLENLIVQLNPSSSGDGGGVLVRSSEHCSLKNVRLTALDTTGAAAYAVAVSYSADVVVDGCHVTGSGPANQSDAGYVFTGTWNLALRNCTVIETAYGIYLDKYIADTLIEGCGVFDCYFGVTSISNTGTQTDLVLRDCVVRDRLAGTSPQMVLYSGVVDNCTVEAGDDWALRAIANDLPITVRGGWFKTRSASAEAMSVAVQDADAIVDIRGARFTTSHTTAMTVGFVSTDNVVTIDGCTLESTGIAISADSGSVADTCLLEITNNIANGAIAVLDTGTSGGVRAIIRGNRIVRGSSFTGPTSAIYVAAAISADISGNHLEASAGDWLDYGIRVDDAASIGAESCIIADNYINCCDTYGIHVSDMPLTTITGNHVAGAAGITAGIYTTNADDDSVTIANNIVEKGINVVGSSGECRYTITGNNITTGTLGITVTTGCESAVISGNTIAAGGVQLLGGGAGQIDKVSVTGNAITGGAPAITQTNCGSNIVFEGNALPGATSIGSAAAMSGVLYSVVNITKTEIVGNAAGDLNHTDGVTLVAAPGAGLIIVPVMVVLDFTYATAAYTGGGNTYCRFASAGSGVTGQLTNSFLQSTSNNLAILHPVSVDSLTANAAFTLYAAAAFTDPGTAAGTLQIRTFYRIIDA